MVAVDSRALSFLGIDSALAQHIAHLFIRDAVILFEEQLHLDDMQDTDLFEVNCDQETVLLELVSDDLRSRTSILPIGNRCDLNLRR